MMLALLVAPPSPASRPDTDARTDTCPVSTDPGLGVKRRPAAPSAAVMKALSAIGVTPSFLNSVPPVRPTILKCVTWRHPTHCG